MTIRWFFSKTVRQLSEMCRQMERVLNEQRDLLTMEAITALRAARLEAREAIRNGANTAELKRQMGKLEEAARKWFKPYANPGVRDNVKEFLVAVVTILAFTTFFLQLTKIPTGSMQPTLFGITYQDLKGEHAVTLKNGTTLWGQIVSDAGGTIKLRTGSEEREIPKDQVAETKSGEFQVPPFWKRIALYWTTGISYKYLVAPFDGYVRDVGMPKPVFPFIKRQPVVFSSPDGQRRETLWIWFPPDEKLFNFGNPGYAASGGRIFKQGEAIVKAKSVAGDHLLVDRFTYNFRHPKRGEIFVFKTKGIEDLHQQDVLYIKRLVALPNEKVQVGNDRHLIINGERLDAGTPRFERVYEAELPGHSDSPYLGHVNEYAARQLGYSGPIAPLMPDEKTVYQMGPKHYLAMGDNTLNSLDSRAWGSVPRENIIGKCWFVYWPFTERFGWGYR
jgi:signal peptidase I